MKTKILKLNNQGEGISYIDNKITFIKNALENETVEIKDIVAYSKYNIAKVEKILEKSPLRIKPKCPYFNECGGCDLQHLKYQDTIRFKIDKVKQLFFKYAHIDNLDIKIIENKDDYNYRNKITLKIVNGKIGFFAARTNDIVEINHCLIAKESINEILKVIKDLNIQNGEVIIRTNYQNELLLNFSCNEKINVKPLKSINNIMGIIHNEKLIYGQYYFIDKIGPYFFKVGYNSFFQINNYTNQQIFAVLESLLPKNQKVLDLYCGVGTLSIVASKKRNQVYGIEINKKAIENALYNNKLNNTNVNFKAGNVSDLIAQINEQFDYIIVDPPRGGLNKKTISYLQSLKVNNLIYISCNPLTLSRDINILKKQYKIQKYYLIDTFSYTNHVESVLLLSLKER